MSTLQFPAEPIPGFKVQLTHEGSSLRLVWSGTLDARDVTTQLQPRLLELHEQILKAGCAQVVLDFSAVDYMNSSAIKCFMAWFLRAERAPGLPYGIDVVFDPGRTWQYVSFTTMGRIAPRVLKTSALTARTA